MHRLEVNGDTFCVNK